MKRRRAGWALAGVLVVSCGGSSGSVGDADRPAETESPSSAPAATTPELTSASAAAPVVTPITIAPCDLITVDEVEAATALVVDTASEESPGTCSFDFGADAGVAVFVSVDQGSGSAMGPASVYAAYAEKAAAGSAEPISDLGVDAVYSSSFRGLAVDAGGGRFFLVGVNGGYGELSAPRDALVAVAGAVIGRLGSA